MKYYVIENSDRKSPKIYYTSENEIVISFIVGAMNKHAEKNNTNKFYTKTNEEEVREKGYLH